MKFNNSTLIIIGLIAIMQLMYVIATPVGPTVEFVSNSTLPGGTGSEVNGTGNDTINPDKAGGFIFTLNLNSVQQNSRWKAYVGNVTGSLTLDDADGFTIYDWTITTSLTGEVYATRAAGFVDWANINCSYDNATHWEEITINHTGNPNDNISATFNDSDNSEFFVGDVIIGANTCPTINLHVNDTDPTADTFEQVLLYDGGTGLNGTNNTNFSNIVYASLIEEDADGYHTGFTYDFQMIVPEIGLSDWTSSTPYYFYVELT